MSYTPDYFWKNFRLGKELHISGSFIYNALYFFDQIEHFCSEEEIFEFLYNISVGLERLEKIAVILIEHNGTTSQEEFEKTLITHNHLELLDRIKKKKELNLGKTHNKFLQLICSFYKSMRYNRFSISSVYKPDQDQAKFIEFIHNELNIEISTSMMFATPNDNRIKNFVGKLVGKIVTQLYKIIRDEASNSNMYTYEIPLESKAFKIFACGEFTFHKERLFKKEIILFLLNNDSDDGFFKFIKRVEPLPFDSGIANEYIRYLFDFHKKTHMLGELDAIYEDNLDKDRLCDVDVIGEDISFDFEEDNGEF